jgi:hypothetical protein
LVETFRDSIFVTKGCLDVTIEDVEEAKAKRLAPGVGEGFLPPSVASLFPVAEDSY